MLQVKSFCLHSSIHKAESNKAVTPRSSFTYRDSPQSLRPSRGFQPCSSEFTCLNGFVPTDFDMFCCSPFVLFLLARPLRTWLVSDRSIFKPHCRSLQLTLYMASTARWTRTQLQADDRTSPLTHWRPGKSMCLQVVNFFGKKTCFPQQLNKNDP